MVETLIAKIFNEKGEILKKFLNKNYIQKYLTNDEISFLEKLPGDTWEEKLTNLNKYKDGNNDKKINNKITKEPLYIYDDIKFYNVRDFAFYVYCKENNIDVFNWIYKNKGKNFFKSHKRKKDYNFKRKILEVKSVNDILTKVYEKRNDNIKVKLVCEKCCCVDYQSPKTLYHFKNMLCKRCRRKGTN